MKIAIVGYGAFGSAVGSYLTKIGHEIQINKIADSDVVVVAVPSFAVLEALLQHKDEFAGQNIIICSKGFVDESHLISEALEEHFPLDKIFFLYGPVLADEFRNGCLSAMVLAGTGSGKEELKSQLESDLLRIEIGEDIIGVQIGASLKNVINILIGIAEGVGYGQNTQAFIFTKGVQEIKNFGVALGAKEETFLGLTCIGDLTLHSRNRLLGVRLGKGEKLDDIIKDMNHTPEGIYAIKNGRSIAKARNIQVPIIDKIHSIIFEGKKIEDVLSDIR